MRGIMFLLLPVLLLMAACAAPTEQTQAPLRIVVDMALGETRTVTLANGEQVALRLDDIAAQQDSVTAAILGADIRIVIDGQPLVLQTGNYTLPVTSGKVQIDCPVVGAYNTNAQNSNWGLETDARFRLWPAGAPYLTLGTFRFPVRDRLFCSITQMSNEPTYAIGRIFPRDKIYYHDALDFGGAEGLSEVLAATDGLVLSADTLRAPDHPDIHTFLARGVVYILDERGWLYSYNHMYSIDAAVKPGDRVHKGQRIGLLGKEIQAGGWAHLHFKIRTKLENGEWAVEDAYPYVWEAYQNEYQPQVIAVARPHRRVPVGHPVVLDGSKSWAASGRIAAYEWQLSSGKTATGPVQRCAYDRPGTYSEILKVTDSAGHSDYDCTVVQVMKPAGDPVTMPTIHAAFHPTLNLQPGDPVTFLVRSFNTDGGMEEWDFGDGSPAVSVLSQEGDPHNPEGFAKTVHTFAKAGDYLVRVSRSTRQGLTATAHLHVPVGMSQP